MKAEVNEIIGKNNKRLQISIWNEKEFLGGSTFKGDNTLNEFLDYLDQNDEMLRGISMVDIYCRHLPFEYLTKFINVEELYIRTTPVLEFPYLGNLTNLKSVRVGELGKATLFKNLSTIPNLYELSIGGFPFNRPVSIHAFDEILKCKQINSLTLGYSKCDEEQLRRIPHMNELKTLSIHQTVETETLAYLSAKMPNVESNELKAWQYWESPKGNIKVNGKRKPFLNKEIDKKKVEKYEKNFEELRNKYVR